MICNLLAGAFDPSLYNKEISIGEAAIDALLGFLTVFLGIAILVYIVWAVGKLMQGASVKKPEKSVKAAKPAKNGTAGQQNGAETEIAAAAAQPVEKDGVSEETVAVISAAIAAIYAGEGRNCGFVVKRIKRM
ncbi:MAG: OadG family protein [Candidatus Scatosoma sp.]